MNSLVIYRKTITPITTFALAKESDPEAGNPGNTTSVFQSFRDLEPLLVWP